jgi:signal transduction histidine kinase
MRLSIRNQILVPLIAIQISVVTAIALSTATLAARRSERQIIDRLNGVIDALEQGNFPYTTSVLTRMRGLSGAQFAAYSEDGRLTAASLPQMEVANPPIRSTALSEHLSSLGASPTVSLGGTRYFAVSIRSPRQPTGSSLVVLYPETSWRQARWEAAAPPIILGGVSLVLMTVATTWIAHHISGRIRRLEQQVARIAEGTFQEVDLGRDWDEVQDLSRSINLMCAQLETMRSAIERSERTRLLAQFAAGLAHQLRNSLTGARMSVQLHARRFPAPEGDQSLEVALRQLAITEEQVRGLLSLGRVESRPPQHLDVDALLGEISLLVHPSCRHAKVAFQHQVAAGRLELVADPSSIRAAVLNLTLNAIEAAGAGGRVRLHASLNANQVRIEIADTGPGPPANLAETLCDPFVTSKPEGVGLGLAIARQVAADHDGRLSWSRENGETHFHLDLPKADGKSERSA